MRLIPPVTVTHTLEVTTAGELLRFRHGSDSQFTLVGVYNDKAHPPEKCLFMFAATNHGIAELYHVFPRRGRTTYLSNGTSYFFEADHSADAVDFNPLQREDPNGLLLLYGNRMLLQAQALPQTGTYGTAHYDIASGEVVERPGDSTVVGLRRWELDLGTPEERRIGQRPLITFDAVRQA